MVAMNIDNPDRKKAILLHFAGPEVHEIFDNLPAPNQGMGPHPNEYQQCVTALTTYFNPQSNVTFNEYQFRKMRQHESEDIEDFYTRLKQQAALCEFHDADHEIRAQVIQGCKNSQLRRKALENNDLNLQQIITKGKALEKTAVQAEEIESGLSHQTGAAVNQISRRYKAKKQEREVRNNTCGLCGGHYPHPKGPKSCPAYGKSCSKCHKLGHFSHVCRSTLNTTGESTMSHSKSYNYHQKENYPSRRPRDTKPTANRYHGRHFRTNQRKAFCTNQPLSYTPQADDTTDDSSIEGDIVYALSTNVASINSAPTAIINIASTPVKMIVDTGANVNILDQPTFQKLPSHVNLSPTGISITPYGAPPLNIFGKFRAQVFSESNSTIATFYVTEGTSGNLLSRDTSVKLKLVSFPEKFTINQLKTSSSSEADKIFDKYPALFQNVGLLKDYEVKLNIDPHVSPVAKQHNRIPINLRDKVAKKIRELEQADIIEPVGNEPTPWISPVVIIPKGDDIRICVDMRAANSAIQRTRHIMPTFEEVIGDLSKSKVFSKLDLAQGYHQLGLSPDSRYITTFSTHLGLRRYKRLNFGINCASEIFQQAIRQAIQGIPNVINVSDDILVHTADEQSHEKTSCLIG